MVDGLGVLLDLLDIAVLEDIVECGLRLGHDGQLCSVWEGVRKEGREFREGQRPILKGPRGRESC